MYYNICYEIAAMILLSIMIIARAKYFKSKDKTVIQFMSVSLLAIATCGVDIIAALCTSDYIHVNDQWMLVVETVYLLFSTYVCCWQLRVVCLRVSYLSESLRIWNFLVAAIMSILLLLNIGVGHVFHYENHELVKTLPFYLIYVVNAIYFLEMAVVLLTKGKKMRRKVFILTSSIFFLPVICILIQLFYDRLILSGIGATMALILFSFSLGDDDYETLQKTLAELEDSKEIEKENRKKAEKAQQVKQIFMKSISSEFEAPIKEALLISEMMEADCEDMEVIGYARQIHSASNQLLRFVDELIDAAGED